jgi:hypothetical protein
VGEDMTESSTSDEPQGSGENQVAEKVFSSEKREDIWAIVIALGIFVFSLAFPEQVYNFFRDTLYLF